MCLQILTTSGLLIVHECPLLRLLGDLPCQQSADTLIVQIQMHLSLNEFAVICPLLGQHYR